MRNGRYYIGSTRDVERRFAEHNRGNVTSTRNNRPLSLLYIKEFQSYEEAHGVELYLKKQKDKRIVKRFMSNDSSVG